MKDISSSKIMVAALAVVSLAGSAPAAIVSGIVTQNGRRVDQPFGSPITITSWNSSSLGYTSLGEWSFLRRDSSSLEVIRRSDDASITVASAEDDLAFTTPGIDGGITGADNWLLLSRDGTGSSSFEAIIRLNIGNGGDAIVTGAWFSDTNMQSDFDPVIADGNGGIDFNNLSAVPEPSSLALQTLAAVMLLRRRRS